MTMMDEEPAESSEMNPSQEGSGQGSNGEVPTNLVANEGESDKQQQQNGNGMSPGASSFIDEILNIDGIEQERRSRVPPKKRRMNASPKRKCDSPSKNKELNTPAVVAPSTAIPSSVSYMVYKGGIYRAVLPPRPQNEVKGAPSAPLYVTNSSPATSHPVEKTTPLAKSCKVSPDSSTQNHALNLLTDETDASRSSSPNSLEPPLKRPRDNQPSKLLSKLVSNKSPSKLTTAELFSQAANTLMSRATSVSANPSTVREPKLSDHITRLNICSETVDADGTSPIIRHSSSRTTETENTAEALNRNQEENDLFSMDFRSAAIKTLYNTKCDNSPQGQNESSDFDMNIGDKKEWPLFGSDGSTGGYKNRISDQETNIVHSSDPDVGNNNWRDGLTTWERFDRLRNLGFDEYKRLKDAQEVTFEVGSGNNVKQIKCDPLMFKVSCDYFQTLSSESHSLSTPLTPGGSISPSSARNKKHTMSSSLKHPNVDPKAFQILIDFIYTGKLITTNQDVLRKVSHAASIFKCQDLIDECAVSLRNNLKIENVIDLHHLACSTKDDTLKKSAVQYFSRNAGKVLSAPSLVKVSEDALYDILSCDEWYLDELEVFKAVTRWALPRITGDAGSMATGLQLRNAMGNIFKTIRFLSIDAKKFASEVEKPNPGLFSPEETVQVYRCKMVSFDAAEKFPFNSNPRGIKASPSCSFSTTAEDDANVISRDNSLDRSLFVQVNSGGELLNCDESSNLTLSNPQTPNSICNEENSCDLDDGQVVSHPPRKKRKYIRKPSIGIAGKCNEPVPGHKVNISPAASTKVRSFPGFVNNLKNEVGMRQYEAISESLKLTKFPQLDSPIHLPHLKLLDLDLQPNVTHTSGSSFKLYLKQKFSSLNKFLFFSSTKESCADSLKSVLSCKINISLKCSGVHILHIDHDKGILLINLVKEAQRIINCCKNVPFKSLALSEVEIASLDAIQRDSLEQIVMKKVRGSLENLSNVIRGCKNLQEISISGCQFGSEEFDLADHLLNQNFKMSKLAIAKCKIADIILPVSNQSNLLQELYLDNCEYSCGFNSSIASFFPLLRRIVLYGPNECRATALFNFLKMEYIEFIFIWNLIYEYDYKMSETGRNELASTSLSVRNFLTAVVGERRVQNKITLELEKKGTTQKCEPGTSSSASMDPFLLDPSPWKGRTYQKQHERFRQVSLLDFKHFSFDKFIPSYETYAFVESTKDIKKKNSNNEKAAANTTQTNSDNEEEYVDVVTLSPDPEPQSNDETDESESSISIIDLT